MGAVADVSVVVPTYNRKGLLPRALESVLVQTLTPRQLIVVDDGSTDGTAALRQRYELPAPAEILWLTQPHRGVSAARNRGIAAAQCAWLAFLDSDDAWLPSKLERQLAAISEQPGILACHTDEIWIRKGRRVNPKDRHAKAGGWIFQRCLPLCCISPSSVLVHRTAFEEIGVFDEELPACEDYDMWLRLTARLPVLYLAERLTVKYGGHPDQLSRSVWGLDRFRIRALDKILSSGSLCTDDARAAEDALREKLQIYLAGARRRGKWGEVAEYERRYESLL